MGYAGADWLSDGFVSPMVTDCTRGEDMLSVEVGGRWKYERHFFVVFCCVFLLLFLFCIITILMAWRLAGSPMLVVPVGFLEVDVCTYCHHCVCVS